MSCGVEEANDRYERVIASSASCVGRLMRETTALLIEGASASESERVGVSERTSERVNERTNENVNASTTTAGVTSGSEGCVSYSCVFNEKSFWRGLLCDSERPTVRKAGYELIAEVHTRTYHISYYIIHEVAYSVVPSPL